MSVRIIAATNRNLEEMIKDGSFREDLFYRLNVLPLFLPPLRDRKEDINSLVEHFMEKFNKSYNNKISGVTDETMNLLNSYNWPGNIRELENVIEHSFVMESGEKITPMSLPDSIRGMTRSLTGSENIADTRAMGTTAAESTDKTTLDFQAQKEEFEKNFIISALKVFNGRINQTALHANIPKKTLLRKLEKYGLSAKAYQNIDRK